VTASTDPVLVLESDGLGVLVKDTSVRHLTFADTSAADITSAVSHILGVGKTVALPDCGQGARTSYSVARFSLLLNGKAFVGWTDSGAAGRTLTTLDGLGVGSTRAELDSSGTAFTYSETTLGQEFSAGALGGVLSGKETTDRVTTFYAGETCFFR
jgi:hypothetical protein